MCVWVCVCKQDLVLNNTQRLIWHKTQLKEINIFHIYIYIYIYHCHHHQVEQVAQIFLTLSRQSILSFIVPDRSSCQQSLSIQTCCRFVHLGHRTLFVTFSNEPFVHWRTSQIILFLLLQQCPAYLDRLPWMVLEIGGRWPYICCFQWSCFNDLFNTVCNILVQLLFSFFFIHFVSVHVVHPYSRHDSTAAWKKCCRESVWVGLFVRSAMIPALSAFVIVSAGYCLLLAFFSVKVFSFIRSIDAWST